MKKRNFLAIVLAIIMMAMMGCKPAPNSSNSSGGGVGPDTPPTYSTEDLVWGAQEVADTWTAGSAAGTAELDGDLVKIKTMAGYGGVKSDTFEMDFSKRVMINIKGYTDTYQTQLVVRVRFAGHSMVSTSGAYIIAENYDNLPGREIDYKNLNGDFSIDIADAIFLYAGAPWYAADDSTMIYAEGDIDDEGNEVLEGDPRIGHLKFEGQKINGYLEVWCQPGTNSGLGAEDAYVAFEEISVTHEDAPAVNAINVNQPDMVAPESGAEDLRPTKGDEPLQLYPMLNVAPGKSADVIYSSTDTSAVNVTNSGLVSFEKATSGNVTVTIFARANIARLAKFDVQVLGNLKSAEAVKAHFEELEYTENETAITPDLESLLEGDVLTAQNASFAGSIEGIQVYKQGNNMTVLNAYDSENTAIANAAVANGGKIEFVADAPDAENAWTYSVYTLAANKVVKGVQNEAAVDGKGVVAYNYVDGTTKVTDFTEIIIIWQSESAIVANRLSVKTVDAKEIVKHYSAAEIVSTMATTIGTVNVSYDEANGVAKLDVSGSYGDIVMELLELSTLDFKNRSVGIILNVEAMNDTYFTIRMYGANAEGNMVSNFSNAYYHDIAGHAYNNRTTAGVWDLQVWRYHQNRQDIITAAETVVSSSLRIQVVDWKQTADATDGYLSISGVTYYYAD